MLFLFNNLLFPLFLKYLQNKSLQVIKLKGSCSHIILYKRRFFPCNNRFHFFDILICSHSNPLFFNSLTQVTHNTHILSEVLLDRDIVFISNFILMSSKLHFRYAWSPQLKHISSASCPEKEHKGQLIWINCAILCLLSNYNLLDQTFKYHSVKLVKNICILQLCSDSLHLTCNVFL